MKRFILLKSNKIIDTNKYDIKREKHLNGNIFLYEKNEYEKLVFLIKPSRIAKEADNLIDLVEVGDLVELDIIGSGKTTKQELVDKNKIFVLGDGTSLAKEILGDILLKIYKPNQNKGYDLAWERGEE